MTRYPVNQAEIVQVIRITLTCGAGTKDDPCRGVVQYWTMDGRRIAVEDPISEDRSRALSL